MTEEEKKIADGIAAKQAVLEASIKDAASKAEVNELKEIGEKLKKELEAYKGIITAEKFSELNKSAETLTKAIETQGTEITKLKQAVSNPGNKGGYKTIEEALYAGFAAAKAEIDEVLKSGQKAPLKISFQTKDAVTMQVDNTIGAGSTQVSITQNTGIVSQIRKRELRYTAHVSVGSIGTDRALWIEEHTEAGTPIMLGEGDSKTQLSVLYEEKTQQVKKCAVYGKVTTEMLADLPQLVSYIQNNLMKRLDIKAEDELFSGNGIGDEIKGFDAFATAFSAPSSLAAQVEDANELDVLEALALQCKLAHGVPNVCFINPSTMSVIKLIKDSTGRPVWKDYVTINGEFRISDMLIVESKAVTAGDFKGGDLSVVNVLNRSEMGIQIGLDGNDFTNNKKTMLLEKRWVQFVSANDTAVIIKGDFTTAKAALLAPGAAA